MPWPENVQTALAVEAVVRGAGAVPAIDRDHRRRHPRRLSPPPELEALAGMKNVMKLSRADLAFALATGRPGATTVAATMIAAHLAGIRVFATGGIGGVASRRRDELRRLGRSARTGAHPGRRRLSRRQGAARHPEDDGIARDAEVPVVSYGQDELPAFWSRDSGAALAAPPRRCGFDRRLHGDARRARPRRRPLVANPVPLADEIPAAEMRAHGEQALADAERDGIRAKAVTPYVLGRILELTGGRSLVTNIALVKNNARLAGEIAAAVQAAGA